MLRCCFAVSRTPCSTRCRHAVTPRTSATTRDMPAIRPRPTAGPPPPVCGRCSERRRWRRASPGRQPARGSGHSPSAPSGSSGSCRAGQSKATARCRAVPLRQRRWKESLADGRTANPEAQEVISHGAVHMAVCAHGPDQSVLTTRNNQQRPAAGSHGEDPKPAAVDRGRYPCCLRSPQGSGNCPVAPAPDRGPRGVPSRDCTVGRAVGEGVRSVLGRL